MVIDLFEDMSYTVELTCEYGNTMCMVQPQWWVIWIGGSFSEDLSGLVDLIDPWLMCMVVVGFLQLCVAVHTLY